MGAAEKLKLNKSADECGLVAEVFRYIPTNFAAKMLDFKQWSAFKWPYPLELETDFVHDASETPRSGAGPGLPADCLHTIVLQNFCLHDTA